MKKYLGLFLGIIMVFVIGCGSTPAPKQQDTAPKITDISAQKKQLQGTTIDGFGYKSSKLDQSKYDNWAKENYPLVMEILNKLPDYNIQVTGHADASGPEEPVGDKPGNIKISTDRAKPVYDALINAGVPEDRLSYKGIGSDDLLPDYDPKAAEQRRVTLVPIAR